MLLLTGTILAISVKNSGTTESEACLVEGLALVYGMVNPSHTLSMPHITLPQQWDSSPYKYHCPCTIALLLTGMALAIFCQKQCNNRQ